ncbi:YjjG family noncanonical pyrimidine nucleotidase [Aquibacillus koreensis]|uniref:YjjG family noncanonical pyrimidine nucleotidase n=1 Tax=Aquibacillus koreensis TaxID=279446 RepID=A0A9X3WR23_9BACI|nr:YjjG family noncanonical pyrimidine nucleotidase [Aquibacillus koreensis]MCT2536177.1 YjjG family noncanonical pyrimidine nucleotidase [Aquibacillus koreensis]MDC3422101.1 YjjG family noncanonical pyrimidine nucleotidase [Aquibacillus koreensis]
MKKYKTLLFDIDDTLLDFGAAEKLALQLLFEEHDYTLTPEMETHYKEINRGLWESFEEGKIEREEVLHTRFSNLFKAYGLEVDGVLLEKSYRNYLGQGNQLLEGALELISDLTQHYDLYIVTNGVSVTQRKRLRNSGLFPLFKDIFISDEIGYQKPLKEFFDHVFSSVPDFVAEETLIIGDSLNADIKGGQQAGLDTCWINPSKKHNHTGIRPTYEMERLEELYQILGK